MKRSSIPFAIVTLALVASPALAGGRFAGRIARHVQTNGNSAVSSVKNAQKIGSNLVPQGTSNWKKGANLLNGQKTPVLTGPTWARPHKDANLGNGLNPTGGKKLLGQSQIPGNKPKTTTATNTVANELYERYTDFGTKADPTPFAAQTHQSKKSILAGAETVTSDKPLVLTANPPGEGGSGGNPGYNPNVVVRDHRKANNPTPAPSSNEVVGVGGSPIDDAIHYFTDPFPHGSLDSSPQEGGVSDHRTTSRNDRTPPSTAGWQTGTSSPPPTGR